MIYLFTGNTPHLLVKESQKWKHAFAEKYGNEQVIHIRDLASTSKDTLLESMLQTGLFSEKRLVIIEGFPYSASSRFSGATELEETITKNLDKIDKNTLIAFVSGEPDKRKSGYKAIKKIAEIKDFSLKTPEDVKHYISSIYSGKIDPAAISRLVHMKKADTQACIGEIEKLLILKDPITLADINSHVHPDFEESIFSLIDSILQKDSSKLFTELDNLLGNSDLYQLFSGLIANIRVSLFIMLLKSHKKSKADIGDILKLGNRLFLVDKRYKTSLRDLSALYKDLIQFERNMKTGKFINSEPETLKGELRYLFIQYLGK